MSHASDTLDSLKQASVQERKWSTRKKKLVIESLVAGWSIRQVVAASGLSTATVMTWKKEAGVVFESGRFVQK